MRVPQVIAIPKASSATTYHNECKAAAIMPSGTIPMPAKQSPTNTPPTPQNLRVTKKLYIQTSIPNTNDAIRNPNIGTNRVLLNIDKGSRRIMQTTSVIAVASLSNGSALSETVSAPARNNAATNTSAHRTANPRMAEPTDSSAPMPGTTSALPKRIALHFNVCER